MEKETINDIWWELTQELNSIPENADINDFEVMANKLLGVTLSQVDDWIDDGCDSGEDEYVMGRSFDLTYKGIDWYLRVFYGNNTREVGCFVINEA